MSIVGELIRPCYDFADKMVQYITGSQSPGMVPHCAFILQIHRNAIKDVMEDFLGEMFYVCVAAKNRRKRAVYRRIFVLRATYALASILEDISFLSYPPERTLIGWKYIKEKGKN